MNTARWVLDRTAAPLRTQWPARVALDSVRHAIDHVDDVLLLMIATRRQLVHALQPLKHAAGIPARDLRREQQVRQRAQRLAQRLGVPESTTADLLKLLIGDACRQQGLATDVDQGVAPHGHGMIAPMTTTFSGSDPTPPAWLGLLPPPRRVAPLLRALPARWPLHLMEAAMARVLAAPLQQGALDFMRERRLGIEVDDLGLRWVFELHAGRLRASALPAEATVRGSAVDLLLLASRLEDADTLFFQRALVLTGDTELGLTVRNLLERLPWDSVPLALRIALNRGARFARAARQAHRSGH